MPSSRWKHLFAALALVAALPAQAESPTLPAPASCSRTLALPDRAQMELRLQDYLQLSEQALSMRALAIQRYQSLSAKSARGEPLSGQDLLLLNQGAHALLAQRDVLLGTALAHECWAQSPPPADPEAASIQRTGVLISLSAALTLYDNYLSAISLFQNDSNLRQHLNRADSGFQLQAGELNKVALMFASADNRRRVRKAIDWYEKHGKVQPPMEGYEYLLQSVEQSPSFQMVKRSHPLKEISAQFEVFNLITLDTLLGLTSEGTHLSSLLFGNTVGLVETRRGKLDHRPEVIRQVAQTLRAGDILLEKTPFRLTDTFIPGHWGHAAIWVGSEAELRQLGIWDHPVVQPHQATIRSGRGIVEALRTGVEMNSVEHFLNVDDLALLRMDNQPAEQRREVLLQTLRQVGKAYDFNFDAETTHRVFCSKLVYLAYGDLNWPTTRFLGKTTISPDNIAQRAIGDGPLNVALLYHDGQEMAGAPRQDMAMLLADQPVQLARQNPGQATASKR